MGNEATNYNYTNHFADQVLLKIGKPNNFEKSFGI
jgi:hypothetical protein